ncbi:MAG TPA: glycosyltransferase family 2 protein [Mucilaginibacter sp.]
MPLVSVVIITKNGAATLAKSIPLLRQVTDDIVLIDNGSTDDTINIAGKYNCSLYQTGWDGYGANKNKGIALARYNWILSIDADEIPDTRLLQSITELQPEGTNVVYNINYKAYYGDKLIRFGNWGRDHHIRLFNRTQVKWNESPVHETLILPKKAIVKTIKGYLHHYSVKNKEEHDAKTIHYAKLSALKYLRCGKKAGFAKMYLAPVFHFLKSYLFLLGFLDGKAGLLIACMAFKNTRLKYYYLNRADKAIIENTLYGPHFPVMAYKFKPNTIPGKSTFNL